jgi:CubicO group peptidase (beta-lactamase class C family)
MRPIVGTVLMTISLGVTAFGGANDRILHQNKEPASQEGMPVFSSGQTWLPGPGPLVSRHQSEPVNAHLKTDNLEDAIDQCVNDDMALLGTPGAAVAVMLDGEVLYEAGYGVKHWASGGAVDADTIFRIGSVTKQLTAAAVMQQVEAGTVFLDEPITRYIPELEIDGHIPADRITVHHILTHCSGYPDLGFDPDGPTEDEALGDWAAHQGSVVLHAPPGVFFNYSNPNFNFAGLVAERASGVPFRDYMQSQIFEAAGMSRTTFDPAVVMADGNYTFGHQPLGSDNWRTYAPDAYDNSIYAPAGYAFSTAGDLVKWALTLMDGGGDVLSPASAATLQFPHASLDLLPGSSYGYGVFTESFESLTIHQHGGNIWGWGAYLIWEPERRFAVAVLANTFQSLARSAYCITDAVLDPDPGPPLVDPADPSAWDRFEGSFEIFYQDGYPLLGEVILVDEGELGLYLWDPESPGEQFFELVHVGFDIFLADFDGDGTPESDVTFIEAGMPSRNNWFRNRIFVGGRQRPPGRIGEGLP